MASTNPGRPAAEKTLVTILNGAPMFPAFPGLMAGQPIPGSGTVLLPLQQQLPATGILTSTGTAVNNLTTASPFAVTPVGADGITRPLVGSMAGRVYLVNAVAAGSLMASESPLIGDPRYWTVALNTTIPPVINTFPGVPLNAGDVRILIMLPTTGWLQWISASGTASLVCTELF